MFAHHAFFRTPAAARRPIICTLLLPIVVLATPRSSLAQAAGGGSQLGMAMEHPHTATPLAELLREADQNNPQIRAARQVWEAAKQIPSQVSTLPDPEFQIQQVNVGSPRPFAGYTNSDFAYLGLGVSQELPYPGKLRLKGEMAKRSVDVVQQEYESVRRSVLAALKAAYFQLSYFSQALDILDNDKEVLREIAQAAEVRYRSGTGTQQDILQVQLEETKLLEEDAHHHLQEGLLEAQVKRLLNRPQSSPDIKASPLSVSALGYSYDQLLLAAKGQNPDIAATEKNIERQKLGVDLAHKDFYPDFSVQYTWQRTDPDRYRAYYMLTFGIRVPIYRGRKQRPELEQAQIDLARAHTAEEVETAQVASDLREHYLTAERTDEMLKIYRDGLMPQARAEFESGLSSYQSNRQEFQPLLESYRDILRLDEDYWQTAAEHETAVAKIEEITGLTLAGTNTDKE